MTDYDPEYIAWVRAGWEQGVITLSRAAELLRMTESYLNDYADADKWMPASDDAHIKACPFCGNTSTAFKPYCHESAIQCSKCESEGPLGESPEEAIAAWNRRCF